MSEYENDELSSENDSLNKEHSNSYISNKRIRRNGPPKPILVCTSDSVKLYVTLLSCLLQTSKKSQRVRCDIDTNGLVFTMHTKGKSMQIKTRLNRDLFQSYTFELPTNYEEKEEYLEEQISFSIHLNVFIDCLSMFGSNALTTTSLRLRYYMETSSLMLAVEENGVMCECSIQVLQMDTNDLMQLEFESAFEHAEVIGRCIVQSEPFADALTEIQDLPNAASVAMIMYPSSTHVTYPKRLSFYAKSETGSCEITFASTSSIFLEYYCMENETKECKAMFHVGVLQQVLRPLGYAKETFLRMNKNGFLSVQHMIEHITGERAFIDALVSPEEYEDTTNS